MNEGAFSRHGVTVVRDFQPVPTITLDKHKVLQILVNVIRNAKYACDESPNTEKRVTVRVRADSGSMWISVADTGVGIAPENLERIFSHGFTTRKDGHGFGLHSCALAAKELGGSLACESPGPGLGATFTLTLPLSQPETSHAR
jgi:signal transduction histidine kinase